MPVTLSAFLFMAFAWGRGILVSFNLDLFTLMLSFVTSLGREAERGTWNLTLPDSSDVTLWHLLTHMILFVLHQDFYGHISILHMIHRYKCLVVGSGKNQQVNPPSILLVLLSYQVLHLISLFCGSDFEITLLRNGFPASAFPTPQFPPRPSHKFPAWENAKINREQENKRTDML